jgi:hypothetical protein
VSPRRNPSLQAKHALLLSVAIAGAIPYGWLAVWSLALAGGIQVVNLAVLEGSVRLVIGGRVARSATQGVLFLRLLLLGAAVLAALGPLRAAPIPFVVGLLVIVPAALWQGASHSLGSS